MNYQLLAIACVLSLFTYGGTLAQTNKDSETQLWCEYPAAGKNNGKKVVLIAGDDEYRSEEALPMLGKILARRHGFHSIVLFPINPEGNVIQPDFQTNIPGMEHLDDADLIILGLRFRNLPDEQMKHFDQYLQSGKPIIGLRTSTHAFNIPGNSDSQYKHYTHNSRDWPGGFGQQVLGDTWVSHHGRHKRESTRGVIVKENASHPVLKGVEDVWGPTDVYGIIRLPESATVLLDGAVLEGMSPDDVPVQGKKNDPMMPLAWVRDYQNKSGATNKIFCTTMGSSTDFESRDLRRMIVNAAQWCTGLEDQISSSANVDYVDPYSPTPYGFGNYKKGTTPADYNLKNESTE